GQGGQSRDHRGGSYHQRRPVGRDWFARLEPARSGEVARAIHEQGHHGEEHRQGGHDVAELNEWPARLTEAEAGGDAQGQSGPVPGQDGALLLEAVAPGWGHRSIMTRSQTIPVTITTPYASTRGSRVNGMGLSWRIASPALAQRHMLPTESRVPRAINAAP